MHAYIRTYIHVCERKRKIERARERQTERERETETASDRDRQRERERERERDLEGLREIVRIQFAKLPCIPAHTLSRPRTHTHIQRESE
jgi:hypothetical protein